jgi:hypothetical protein
MYLQVGESPALGQVGEVAGELHGACVVDPGWGLGLRRALSSPYGNIKKMSGTKFFSNGCAYSYREMHSSLSDRRTGH